MEQVEVTQGQNGYPKNIYSVIIADTISEMEEVEKMYPGTRIMMRQRDGWHLWEKVGDYSGNLLDMPAKDSDTVIRYRNQDSAAELAYQIVVGDYGTYTEALAEIHPSATLNEAIEILTSWKERIAEIEEEITEGNHCDIWMNNPDPTSVNFAVDEQSTSYRDDVWNYQLAIVAEITEQEEKRPFNSYYV